MLVGTREEHQVLKGIVELFLKEAPLQLKPRMAHKTALNEEVDNVAAHFTLNAQQRMIVLMSVLKRILLVQGPPGTGKSRTALAIAYLHFHRR